MKIPEETKIYVDGLGIYTYETLVKSVREKAHSLTMLAKAEEFDMLTENNLNVFKAMWLALSKAIEKQNEK